MSSIRTALKAKLASISVVNSTVTGIYTPPLPEGANYPLVMIQRVLHTTISTLNSPAAAERDLWQVDVYASGAGAWIIVDALSEAIKTALDGIGPATWSGVHVLACHHDDDRDLPEGEQVQGQEGIVRRSADYIIKYETS